MEVALLQALWRLEPDLKPWGKIITTNQSIRIKHVLTRQYLSMRLVSPPGQDKNQAAAGLLELVCLV